MGNYILGPNGEFVSADELYHWGIKGMKWGVRRYQNKDGSLTPAGKRRKKIEQREMEPKEMLASMPRIKDVFKDYRSMSKLKTKDDIQDWAENEDAKIRDELYQGKITRKEADHRWDLLASRTEYMLTAVKGQQYANEHVRMNLQDAQMHAQMHQQMVDNFIQQQHVQTHQQMVNNTMLQNHYPQMFFNGF